MTRSWGRIRTVARREFLATVRRKAFLLTLIGTPAYFAFVTFLSAGSGIKERSQALEDLRVIGVVDSSGLFSGAQSEITTDVGAADIGMRRGPDLSSKTLRFTTQVRFYADAARAQAAIRAHEISQALIIPPDYLQTGRIRRFARSNNLFSSADRRVVAGWLARNLVRGRVDSVLAARVARPAENELLYALNKEGQFELKDDRREIADFMMPMFFSLLLGLAIIIGGQYLLQGVAEEKESRILESILCHVSAEELMAGKLFGLGAVGLLVIGTWVLVGLAASGPALAMLPVVVAPPLIAIAVVYFVLGYLFFGSIMTGIGAITNNMREAQQFAVWFTFANFVPFIMITTILGHPDSGLAAGLSLFPPTASTAMMLRLTAPSSAVPAWQIGLSLGLLAASGWILLRGAARVFRVGLLMYGKTPNLPEILRWATRA
jgi:ABC-2 type transport system permease protein